MPIPTKYLSPIRELKFPMVAIPIEYANRYKVSMRPNCGAVILN